MACSRHGLDLVRGDGYPQQAKSDSFQVRIVLLDFLFLTATVPRKLTHTSRSVTLSSWVGRRKTTILDR
jgi:hypothetical protein